MLAISNGLWMSSEHGHLISRYQEKYMMPQKNLVMQFFAFDASSLSS